ncbi:GGDEF domain-containing protein [Halomonas aquatica]|uniref:Diguanylate cyclase n=1 Tax=Halomonas aquatica TaxID=3151123 RepID=A0ABV1NEF6_9GAMM
MAEFDLNFKDVVEFANDVIIITKAYPLDEPGPEIVYVNRAFTELTGYSLEEVAGKSPRILQSSVADEDTTRIIRQGLEDKVPVRVTIMNYSKDGKGYWLDLSIMPLRNSQGEVTHFAAIERDVTEQVNTEEALKDSSRKDPLTKLLNKAAFDEILENEFSRFKRNDDIFSLLMIDIDHFKSINDNYGHPVGDIAIETVARSCEKYLRSHDVMARVGGEEFCVLLPCTKKKAAFTIARRLREIIMNTSIATASGDVSMTISVGVSEVENADIDHADVYKRADENLYRAKKAGRNRVCM